MPHSIIHFLTLDFHDPQSSPEISQVKAYENYVSEYIGNHEYVGIIFRTHCVMHYVARGDFETKSQLLLNCSKQLKHTLDKVRNKWEIFMAWAHLVVKDILLMIKIFFCYAIKYSQMCLMAVSKRRNVDKCIRWNVRQRIYCTIRKDNSYTC